MNNENNDFLEKGGYNELLKKSIVFFNNLPIEKQNTYVEIFEFTPNMLLNKNMTGGGHKHKTNQYLLLIALQYYYLKEYYDLEKKNASDYIEKLQNIFSVKIDDDKIEKIKREKRRIDIAKNIENNLKVEVERKEAELKNEEDELSKKLKKLKKTVSFSFDYTSGGMELQNIFDKIKEYEKKLNEINKNINAIKTIIVNINNDNLIKEIINKNENKIKIEDNPVIISKNTQISTTNVDINSSNNETKMESKNTNLDEKKIIDYIIKYIDKIKEHKEIEIENLKSKEKTKQDEIKKKEENKKIEKQKKSQQQQQNQQSQNQNSSTIQLTKKNSNIQKECLNFPIEFVLFNIYYSSYTHYNKPCYDFLQQDNIGKTFIDIKQHSAIDYFSILYKLLNINNNISNCIGTDIMYLKKYNFTNYNNYVKYFDDKPPDNTLIRTNDHSNYIDVFPKNDDNMIIFDEDDIRFDDRDMYKEDQDDYEHNNNIINYLTPAFELMNQTQFSDHKIKIATDFKIFYPYLHEKRYLNFENKLLAINLNFVLDEQKKIINNKKYILNEKINELNINNKQNIIIIGIVIFNGKDGAGHYTTYIRKDTEIWYFCNDDTVKEYTITFENLCNMINFDKMCFPSILFYTNDLKNINKKKNDDNANSNTYYIPKINNFGSSCYRNVIYQNLFNFKPFVDYLEEKNTRLGTNTTYNNDNDEEKNDFSISSNNIECRYKKTYIDARTQINELNYENDNKNNKYENIVKNIYYFHDTAKGLLLEPFDENTIIVDPAGIAFNGGNKYNGGELSGAIYKLFGVLSEDGNAKKHNFGKIETTQNLFNTLILNENKKTENIIGVIHAVGPNRNSDYLDSEFPNDSYFYDLQNTLENIKENMTIFDNFKGVLRLPLISGGEFRGNIELCDYFDKFIEFVLKIFVDINYTVVVFTYSKKENKCYTEWKRIKSQTPLTPQS